MKKSMIINRIAIVLSLSMMIRSLSYADSHLKKEVVPGVIHHVLYVDEGPWSINVLEIDLKDNSSLNLKTHKADKRLIGRKKLSDMSRELLGGGFDVVGGVNGDFFSSEGVQVGMQVVDGLIISKPCDRSVFGLTAERKPFIEILDYEGQIYTANGQFHEIHTINSIREKDFLVLYNSFIGSTTRTNKWGTEVAIEIVGETTMNDTITGVVRNMETRKGNMLIPEKSLVLSGHDSGHEFLMNNILKDDTVKIHLGLNPLRKQIEQAIGGVPRLLRHGKVTVEYLNESISEQFATARHPRTAVGFSQDSTTVFLVTVDGRQPGFSEGMNLYELAQFLLTFNIHDALNLDGGGSTTMVIRDQVVNSPSDHTGERPVANGLFIMMSSEPRKL